MKVQACEAAVIDARTGREAHRCREPGVFKVERPMSGKAQVLCEEHAKHARGTGVKRTRIAGW